MKPNRPGNGLVHVPRDAGTDLARYEGHDKNPAAVYLGSLSLNSRPAMKSALTTIAKLVNASADCMTMPWSQIRISHSKAIRVKLVETFSPRTVNRMLSAMRGVLKAAWELEQMSTDDYMRAIQVKHMSTTSLPPAGRYIEEAELAELLKAAASQKEPLCFRDVSLLIFMYAGGLRRQEVSALDLADYDPRDGAFKVLRGKGRKYRDLAIASGYRSWIEPWVAFQKKRRAEPMFVRWTVRGEPTMHRLGPVGVDHALDHVRTLAKVDDFAPHDLRRSFATLLLDRGVDVMVVQDLMGHASLNTTKIYDRRGVKTRKAAVEQLPVVLTFEDYKRSQ